MGYTGNETTMNQLEIDKQIVDELRKIMWKHRSIGAIRMLECIRFALEKETQYAPKSKSRNRQVDGREVTANDFTRTRCTGKAN